MFRLTECWCAGNSDRLLLHDGGQCRGQLIALELQLDELHGYGELHLVHPPVVVHVSEGPAKEAQHRLRTTGTTNSFSTPPLGRRPKNRLLCPKRTKKLRGWGGWGRAGRFRWLRSILHPASLYLQRHRGSFSLSLKTCYFLRDFIWIKNVLKLDRGGGDTILWQFYKHWTVQGSFKR